MMRAATNEAERAFEESTADCLAAELEAEGIVLLPTLLSGEQIGGMRQAFEARLQHLRWNDFDGYHQTEPYRHMVEDVLLLDQGFVDLALHPLIRLILNRYLGNQYELAEAKGWKSLATKTDFHGWHGDAWYDQGTAQDIPKEVKLALYLTDVRSGAFSYIKRSHRRRHPGPVRNDEVVKLPASQITEMSGLAGTAFLFDTSGTHRQGVPILEPRQAIFYNFHDPHVALQEEDVAYYRYHPLLLNAAFLGGLSEEDQRILGFGNKTNFRPAFERRGKPFVLYRALSATFAIHLHLRNLFERIAARIKR